MSIATLLEMAADGMPNRVALGPVANGVTFSDLWLAARRAGALLAGLPVDHVALLDVNSTAVPLALFGSAIAGKPFVPINYRLPTDRWQALLGRIAPAVVVTDMDVPRAGLKPLSKSELIGASRSEDAPLGSPPEEQSDDVAILIFTSGTTGEPKAAMLRHRNLTAYVFSTVEFLGADEDECALVSVPPYHIAAVSAVLTATYSGRRVVYLENFDAKAWVDLAEQEGVTHAMVVPTMLGRILHVLETERRALPSLRHLSYGGGPMPTEVVERALQTLPEVAFVNAYGLTETSSTISVLGPEEHRVAVASRDPLVRRRLGSVGRPLPSIEVTVRDPLGRPLPAETAGEIWVRGAQVSGEYLGTSPQESEGWFATRDGGLLDESGYLYVHGRLDDVIVRGGENLSPAEIETALLSHPAVAEAAVVGIPDREWGEAVGAVVVLREGASSSESELQAHVRSLLRSSMTPKVIVLRSELPYNETGKLLRRVLREELATDTAVRS